MVARQAVHQHPNSNGPSQMGLVLAILLLGGLHQAGAFVAQALSEVACAVLRATPCLLLAAGQLLESHAVNFKFEWIVCGYQMVATIAAAAQCLLGAP